MGDSATEVIIKKPPRTDNPAGSSPNILSNTNSANDTSTPNICNTNSVSNPLPVHKTKHINNPGISVAIINCQSISAKKASFTNFISDQKFSTWLYCV